MSKFLYRSMAHFFSSDTNGNFGAKPTLSPIESYNSSYSLLLLDLVQSYLPPFKSMYYSRDVYQWKLDFLVKDLDLPTNFKRYKT